MTKRSQSGVPVNPASRAYLFIVASMRHRAVRLTTEPTGKHTNTVKVPSSQTDITMVNKNHHWHSPSKPMTERRSFLPFRNERTPMRSTSQQSSASTKSYGPLTSSVEYHRQRASAEMSRARVSNDPGAAAFHNALANMHRHLISKAVNDSLCPA